MGEPIRFAKTCWRVSVRERIDGAVMHLRVAAIKWLAGDWSVAANVSIKGSLIVHDGHPTLLHNTQFVPESSRPLLTPCSEIREQCMEGVHCSKQR